MSSDLQIYSEVITGSRQWDCQQAIWSHLNDTHARCVTARIQYFVNVGDCPTGVDLFVREWLDQWGLEDDSVEWVVYYADWVRNGRAAGPIRNRQMIKNAVPDMVTGFLQLGAGNRGTLNCLSQAEELGFKTSRHWSNEVAEEMKQWHG